MLSALAILTVALSFTLSASAGLGGSLILVPAMALFLGPKHGIAVAALLLATNNVGKVIVYRKTIPIRQASWIFVLTVVGAAVGARLMVSAPEALVYGAILVSIALSLLLEQRTSRLTHKRLSPIFALLAGAASGFSGSSGPLKGMAIRALGLDRLHFVGAASLVSLAGDGTKAVVFTTALGLESSTWVFVAAALPIVPVAVLSGRYINKSIGERAFAGLFWLVMAGYSLRMMAYAL